MPLIVSQCIIEKLYFNDALGNNQRHSLCYNFANSLLPTLTLIIVRFLMFSKLSKILHSEDMNMTNSSVVAFLEPCFNAHCTNHTFFSCNYLTLCRFINRLKSQWNFTAQLLLLHVHANQVRFTFLEYEQLTQYIFILIGG